MAVCILEKLCFSCRPSPLPCRFPRMRMILFAVLYIIYKLLRFVSFVLLFQRRRFLAILYAFFVYFYVLSKILREFFIQNKTLNTKRRIFLFFFFCCQKISLNKPFFSSALSFLSLCSPLLRRKSRELIFSLRSIFLSTAQKKTRISLSALPAAACVLRVFFCRIESFILAKSAEENSQHSRIFLFFRGKKTLFSQEFFSQFSRRKLAIYLLYIKR